MNRFFGLILALIVLLGVGYVLAPYLRTGQTPTPVPEPSEVSVTTETVQEDSEEHLIDAEYPQFGAATIDADIKSKIETTIRDFKAIPPSPPEVLTPKNEFSASFEDVYIGPDVISLKLVFSEYTGGAHPISIVSGLNYERATGRQLLQSDAFAMLGLSVEEVSVQATAELRAKLGTSMFEEGANSNPENFSSFVISEDRITFIFQPYQVASYAAGVQEVSFERKR